MTHETTNEVLITISNDTSFTTQAWILHFVTHSSGHGQESQYGISFQWLACFLVLEISLVIPLGDSDARELEGRMYRLMRCIY
jgi:hypothetical protein